MKLAILIVLSASFAWLLMFGAMKTAEKIAKHQTDQIEAVAP